ncbi:MAG: dipeptidyl-peptidase 3 family protein [Myxococcota bacterium]
MKMNLHALFIAMLSVALSSPAVAAPDAAQLQKLSARLTPVELTADVSKLPESERAALVKILQAAQLMDPLFLRQVWAGNEALLMQLSQDSSPLGKARLHAFLQNKGPWLRLDEDRPFLPAVGEKPAEANFYPAGATKAEVEQWLKGLSDAERAKATGFFTTLRRTPEGKLTAIPYSVEYQGELARAAALLREAAALTREPTLKDFLEKRAAAFSSNDYYASDVAWMKLDASIEPTLGPYEVYEDDWFNAKAAFEAFVTVRDDAETAKLAKFAAGLQDIENHLPIDAKYKNPKLGAMAPIRVVSSLYSSGDANRGVQTAAFNLPNDEKIGKEMGTKRTMLKNVQEAKFQKVLIPISGVALAPADRKRIAFDAFFTHILMHELMHGLGPHTVSAGGKEVTVREKLQETYSAIEEAKADISGLFALQYLVDKGVIDKAMEKTMYVTFLASSFRSIRFGIHEAHGKGQALQLNYLLDAGAYRVNEDGTFSVDSTKVKDAVKKLTAELMTLQAEGNKTKALELLARLAVIRPETQKVLDKLQKVPVDIEPKFVTAQKLLEEASRAAAPKAARP